MSTDYRPLRKIRFSELFDGRLERYGIRELLREDDREDEDKIRVQCRCLTDGRNYMRAYGTEGGYVSSFTRPAFNASDRILHAISESFDTGFVCEHQPQYWGFETEEEWDAFVTGT